MQVRRATPAADGEQRSTCIVNAVSAGQRGSTWRTKAGGQRGQ